MWLGSEGCLFSVGVCEGWRMCGGRGWEATADGGREWRGLGRQCDSGMAIWAEYPAAGFRAIHYFAKECARKWVRGSCHAVCCAYKQHLRQQRTLANGTKAAEWGRAPKLGIWFANALKHP